MNRREVIVTRVERVRCGGVKHRADISTLTLELYDRLPWWQRALVKLDQLLRPAWLNLRYGPGPRRRRGW
jgi:hypothetical protein